MRNITWITALALAATLGCTKQGTTTGTPSTSAQTGEDRQNQSGTAGSAGMEPGTTADARRTGTTGTENPAGPGTGSGSSMGTTDSTGTTGSMDQQKQAGTHMGMMYEISRVDMGSQEVVLVPHQIAGAGHGDTTGTGSDRELQSGTELRLSFDDIRRLSGKEATGSATTAGDITSSLREGAMVKVVPIGSSAPTSAQDIQSIKLKDKSHMKDKSDHPGNGME